MANTTSVNICGMGCGKVPDEHFDTCEGRRTYGQEWHCECGNLCLAIGGHDVTCGDCGREYNGFGQRLRSDWRDNQSNYDEGISDLYGHEMACLASE